MIGSFAREKDMDNWRQTSKKHIMENWFPSVLKILLKDHTRFKPDMKFIELHDCIQRCKFWMWWILCTIFRFFLLHRPLWAQLKVNPLPASIEWGCLVSMSCLFIMFDCIRVWVWQRIFHCSTVLSFFFSKKPQYHLLHQ